MLQFKKKGIFIFTVVCKEEKHINSGGRQSCPKTVQNQLVINLRICSGSHKHTFSQSYTNNSIDLPLDEMHFATCSLPPPAYFGSWQDICLANLFLIFSFQHLLCVKNSNSTSKHSRTRREYNSELKWTFCSINFHKWMMPFVSERCL